MGWASGVNREGREVGYSVEAICDRPGCMNEINRGLSHVCGGMHDGGEHGCGKYFCDVHLQSTWTKEYCYLCEKCMKTYEAAHPEDEDDDE